MNAWLLDLGPRGYIAVSGEDRARLLHAMCTNHVQALKPGEFCYAFFLNAQGRIQADANILCREEEMVLDTEPEVATVLTALLDKFIIADDVTLDNQTELRAALAVEGPGAAAVLENAGLPRPAADHWEPWEDGMVAAISATGLEGWRVFVPAESRERVAEVLREAGALDADAATALALRVEQGRPRFWEDFGPGQIPHETDVLRALHFSKGCYLGQEIVERVRSRGQVNRKMFRLSVDGEVAPPPGSKLMLEDKVVGDITSSAVTASGVVALGYVRVEAAGKELSAGECTARTVGSPR